MAKMDITLREVLSETHAQRVQERIGFMLGHQIGAQFGFLTGASASQGKNIIAYNAKHYIVGVGCPLFKELRLAIQLRMEVERVNGVPYPRNYDEWMNKVINRYILIIEPDEWGELIVLMVQTQRDGSEEVEHKCYNFEQAKNDPIGSFLRVATDIVQFFIKDKPE